MVAMARMQRAFTLIEVLVVMAIVAILLTLVTPRYFDSIHRAKEATLKHDLAVIRDAIDKYYSDTGGYPDTLEDLVQRKYLRAVPQDPLTASTISWVVVPPPLQQDDVQGSMYDIRSGAPGLASDGSSYAEW